MFSNKIKHQRQSVVLVPVLMWLPSSCCLTVKEHSSEQFPCEAETSQQSRTFLLTIISSLQQKAEFNFFSSEGYGGGTVLFSESSTMFQEVASNEPVKWMGQNYYNTMKAMDCKKEGKSIFLFFVCQLLSFSHLPLICLPTHRRPPVVRGVQRRAAEMWWHGLWIPEERPDSSR